MPDTPFDPVINVADAPDEIAEYPHYSHTYKVLTPHMRAAGGSLGVCQNTLPPKHTTSPFHWHLREDEVFFIQSGRGILRYGDTLREIGPGDCISCPAGTRVAHQIANPFDEPLVYLGIGPYDPHEVCGYPDTGKVMVRGLQTVGRLTKTEYMDGEPDYPRILELWAAQADKS